MVVRKLNQTSLAYDIPYNSIPQEPTPAVANTNISRGFVYQKQGIRGKNKYGVQIEEKDTIVMALREEQRQNIAGMSYNCSFQEASKADPI